MRTALILTLSALLLGAGCDRPEEGTIWRFAIEETRGSVQDAYAQRFAELIEERSGGRIDVKIYPYGTLGTSDQITELVHNGSIQFAMASPGHLGTLIPEVQVFLLHHLLTDDSDVNNAALGDEALVAAVDALYAEKNFKLLALYTEGWMVWTTNQPVRTPADFEGVKMRVMTSPLLLAAYDAYGASPTPLPYSEVYSALQLNMIDGQVNPVFAIQEMSFYEVTDYMIFPGHAEFITSAMTNRDFYDALAPADRALLDQAIEDLQGYIFDVQRQFNAERMAIIEQNKPSLQVIHLSEDEQAAFRERSAVVKEQFVDHVGPRAQQILDQVLAAVERAEAATAADPL